MRFDSHKLPLKLMFIFVLAVAGCDYIAPSPTPTLPALAEEGRRVFTRYCSNCHSAQPEMVIVGPSLAGIASRAGTRMEGMDAEAYIRDSIMNPGAYTVEGYREGLMPEEIFESLTQDEFEAVVAYLMTLE